MDSWENFNQNRHPGTKLGKFKHDILNDKEEFDYFNKAPSFKGHDELLT